MIMQISGNSILVMLLGKLIVRVIELNCLKKFFKSSQSHQSARRVVPEFMSPTCKLQSFVAV